MTLQAWIVLAAVSAAVIYFAKSIAKGFRGTGGCASGCGNCGASVCPAKRLNDRLARRA